MKCGWTNFHEQLEGEPAVYCDNEATHNENCAVILGEPVCAEHTCRCSVPLVEIERRRQARIIPASWMAL
jgi:hypothetical protein